MYLKMYGRFVILMFLGDHLVFFVYNCVSNTYALFLINLLLAYDVLAYDVLAYNVLAYRALRRYIVSIHKKD